MNKIALSFDVEDWFCVRNMNGIISYENWHECESRVYESTRYILDVLKERKIKATFFVLGWIAEKIPGLVQEIDIDGHEIASHGYAHQPITSMTKDEFEEDLIKSLDVLGNLTSKPISGYRAPSFSITTKTLWALDVLQKNGISYDSSIYPTRHPDYGIPGLCQSIQELRGIIEFPLSSYSVMGMEIPVSGGGYFRLFPYRIFKKMLKANMEKYQAIAYFHPWEFDYGQPRIKLPAIKKFRHYVGLKNNKKKFEIFLDDFEFCPIIEILKENHLYKALKEFPEIVCNSSII